MRNLLFGVMVSVGMCSAIPTFAMLAEDPYLVYEFKTHKYLMENSQVMGALQDCAKEIDGLEEHVRMSKAVEFFDCMYKIIKKNYVTLDNQPETLSDNLREVVSAGREFHKRITSEILKSFCSSRGYRSPSAEDIKEEARKSHLSAVEQKLWKSQSEFNTYTLVKLEGALIKMKSVLQECGFPEDIFVVQNSDNDPTVCLLTVIPRLIQLQSDGV